MQRDLRAPGELGDEGQRRPHGARPRNHVREYVRGMQGGRPATSETSVKGESMGMCWRWDNELVKGGTDTSVVYVLRKTNECHLRVGLPLKNLLLEGGEEEKDE